MRDKADNRPDGPEDDGPAGLVVRKRGKELQLQSDADERSSVAADALASTFGRREEMRVVELEGRIGELERLFHLLCDLFQVKDGDYQALIQKASRESSGGAADGPDGLWVRWVHPVGEALEMPRLPRLGDIGAVTERAREVVRESRGSTDRLSADEAAALVERLERVIDRLAPGEKA